MQRGVERRSEILFHVASHGMGFSGPEIVYDDCMPIADDVPVAHFVPNSAEIAHSLGTKDRPSIVDVDLLVRARNGTALGRIEQYSRENYTPDIEP